MEDSKLIASLLTGAVQGSETHDLTDDLTIAFDDARTSAAQRLAFAAALSRARGRGWTDEYTAKHIRETTGRRISASSVSSYAKTYSQLRAAAAIDSEVFDEWFRLTSTGRSADVREGLVHEVRAIPDLESKRARVRSAAEKFFRDRNAER